MAFGWIWGCCLAAIIVKENQPHVRSFVGGEDSLLHFNHDRAYNIPDIFGWSVTDYEPATIRFRTSIQGTFDGFVCFYHQACGSSEVCV